MSRHNTPLSSDVDWISKTHRHCVFHSAHHKKNSTKYTIFLSSHNKLPCLFTICPHHMGFSLSWSYICSHSFLYSSSGPTFMFSIAHQGPLLVWGPRQIPSVYLFTYSVLCKEMKNKQLSIFMELFIFCRVSA